MKFCTLTAPSSMPTSRKLFEVWSGRGESNPRPTAWEAVTLPLSYSRSSERTGPSCTMADDA